MSIDPRSLVVSDGTTAIEVDQYKERDLERVFIPKSVVEIRDSAFRGCKDLRKVVFEVGSRLKTIGNGAFYQCSGLTAIDFPEGLERIGMFAFSQSGLESVTFPASLRTISQAAFTKCEHLRTVMFRDGLEVLGTDEFLNGSPAVGVFKESAVERVELPSTLRRLEHSTFHTCKSLTHI